MPVLSHPPPLAQLERVSFRYPERERAILHDVEWSVPEGAYIVVAGYSGSGKSTLLRCLSGLVPHFSGGRFGGAVRVGGNDTRRFAPRDLGRMVGFVFQDPEAQMVTHRVEDELAFGMEQLGVDSLTMRKRVEEVLDLLSIAPLRDRDPSTLSGGERQRVAVGAALTTQPRLLVLDEPTSQLDPWGAEEVLSALTRLNEDLGLTVVLAEHRLERVIGHADVLRVVGSDGTLEGSPRDVLAVCDTILAPPIVRLGRAREWSPLPLTIKEGRTAVLGDPCRPIAPATRPLPSSGQRVIDVQNLTANQGRRAILRGIDFDVSEGEVVALMGRNGSGKTTLLRTLMGLHRPASGRVTIAGRDAATVDPSELAGDVGYLPQRPLSILFNETVRDELRFTLKHRKNKGLDSERLLAELGLSHLANHHPHDLSVGEQERAALAAVLVASPRILLLDEPTRGMDALRKRQLTDILRRHREAGTAIVVATHDVEWVAGLATRVVLLGDGEFVADGDPGDVLSGSLTFATQMDKLYGHGFLTVDDVLGADWS